MNESIKKRIIGAIELLPYGHDIYLQLTKNRLGISYRGIFSSYAEALAKISASQMKYYDIINSDKADHLERELKGLDTRVLDIDYPLLFWLARILSNKMNILELGGSIGHAYYSFQKYIPYPEHIHWTIAELQQAVTLGRNIAHDRGETRLSFIESQYISEVHAVDLFMSAGTLQYMEKSLSDIIENLNSHPKHILIHNLPTHGHKPFWTLQRLKFCELPYRIYSSSDLINCLNLQNYELIDSWSNPREINIPFHLDVKIEGYSGFYFKRKQK